MKRSSLSPAPGSPKRRKALERKTPLRADPEATRAFEQRGRASQTRKRRPVSPASPAQRSKVKLLSCLVCAGDHVHPAHLIDRSLCPTGADDPRAVVPLCPGCHRDYDEGALSILEHLEPRYRLELAFAVERFGLISTLERVTCETWRPLDLPEVVA